LYGTTFIGGRGFGTVFKVDPTGKETVLHRFAGGADGAYPKAGLNLDKEGNLCGTTSGGGTSNNGTVFKVNTAGNQKIWLTTGRLTADARAIHRSGRAAAETAAAQDPDRDQDTAFGE
jgi:uncharacterized repeat protein (TIGR03803 family)